jgi:hypothetical protein
VANPTTTAPPVNFNKQDWFELILAYLEMSSLVSYVEANPYAPISVCWPAVWPTLLDGMLRAATRKCVAELNDLKLIQPN